MFSDTKLSLILSYQGKKFDNKIKNDKEYLFYYTPAAPNKIKVGECQQDTVNFSDNTTIFFLKKNQLQHIQLRHKGTIILNSTIINY